MGTTPLVAKAMLHRWEEPCISGKRGSGTVFFTGCALGCIYCQNRKISMEKHGKPVAPGRLREIYFELIEQGAHNQSRTPSHFADGILSSLEGRLPVPVVYNTGGYDSVETLKRSRAKYKYISPT
jgi:putative pyruvate formate lyase activating enzyme